MNFEKHLDVINACRFCFMCRHLSPLGNVTFKEADTPRGRALIADKVRINKSNLENADYVETIFESPVSAACRTHCVSHYNEAGLVLELRKDIVEAGLAPEKIKAAVEELKKVEFKVEGSGSTLYYQDQYSDNAAAFAGCKVISGGDTGKALEVLGFTAEAEAVFAKFKKAVADSGCTTIVTSCPASYDMMKGKLDGVKVLHSSEFIEGKRGSASVYLLASDYLKNYNDMTTDAAMLERLGYTLKPFGTNREESYSVGEGAVIYDQLYPELAKKLCDHIVEFADNPAEDILVTSSPYTKSTLNKYAPQLKVMLLDEIAVKGV